MFVDELQYQAEFETLIDVTLEASAPVEELFVGASELQS